MFFRNQFFLLSQKNFALWAVPSSHLQQGNTNKSCLAKLQILCSLFTLLQHLQKQLVFSLYYSGSWVIISLLLPLSPLVCMVLFLQWVECFLFPPRHLAGDIICGFSTDGQHTYFFIWMSFRSIRSESLWIFAAVPE